jgi:hypothetical protein
MKKRVASVLLALSVLCGGAAVMAPTASAAGNVSGHVGTWSCGGWGLNNGVLVEVVSGSAVSAAYADWLGNWSMYDAANGAQTSTLWVRCKNPTVQGYYWKSLQFRYNGGNQGNINI